MAATPQQQQSGLACQAHTIFAAPQATGSARGVVPCGAASGRVLCPAAAATLRTQMLRTMHAQEAHVAASQAAVAEAVEMVAATHAALAESVAKIKAQNKLVIAALENQASVNLTGASSLRATQTAPSAAIVADAGQRPVTGTAFAAMLAYRSTPRSRGLRHKQQPPQLTPGHSPRWDRSAAWRSCGPCTARAARA